MVAFSKPIQDGDLDLRTKRKRTINPKLLDNDNMSSDAVKRRKLEALKFNQTSGPLASSSQSIAATTSSPEPGAHLSSTAPSAPSTSAPSTRQASVETVEDDHDHFRPNAGTPKNPETILESVHDDDDTEFTPLVARKREAKKKQTGVVDESSDKEPGKKETDDEELGKLNLLLPLIRHLICSLERLQRDWRSKIYAFFNSEVKIKYPDGRKCHEFTCSAKYCKGKGKNPRTVRRYLDTKDRASTKSLRAHALHCWGPEIVEKSEEASNIASARDALKKADLRDGSITAVFERTGKGKVTYSHRPHTENETWYVCLLEYLWHMVDF
jgi:hypothetical protein